MPRHSLGTTTRITLLSALALPLLVAPALADEHAGRDITYEIDGEAFEGYLATAEGDAQGSVLIIHDWDGLDDYERKRADMLAEQGYDAFAIDLYGQGNRPQELDARKEETARLYEDRERMRALTLGGLAEARAQGAATDMVVMGYCFGGAVVLELARSGEAMDIAGYASFHGGLGTPEGQSYESDTPPILIAHGGADESISLDDVATLGKELEDAGVTYEIEVYSGAPHAFTVFGSDRYQQRADEKSWAAFLDLLDETLGE
ncbi:dienelactone hydrolase family protein [Halomonas urumqiensis]|uniref:Dienelactone hydrolase n=1 Tax=Halomonas urumqiensis TaxID=1684789 RepID=A0A2N7UKH4_9GAMM|nr:dienelactone hydrolase family protein [Halomonas urumqiensis]PMR80909.1 dienelactone hydrolase [Halomonas urumqiensis]PTB02867.1 dienelactone hydrolase family protein [Halomonas urumqiensis]GHE21389.1 dienelactone hydrolase [Halomonas urumqiensis]